MSFTRFDSRRAPAVALVDCNNFYASCERVFRPDLRGRPIVVLSNNDGCVIARSSEAKELGVPMGEPFFRIRRLVERKGMLFFSSNYALYGNLSDRVMRTLAQFTPELEVYSIDEAFLNLSGVMKARSIQEENAGLVDYGRDIRSTVFHWTGIPISVGIAETKTLAKIANRVAKKTASANGVLNLRFHSDIDGILEEVEIGDVWGIGRMYASRLKAHGIENARQLRDCDERWVQREMRMGIVGVRMVLELRGQPCIPMDLSPSGKKAIACTRSFSRPVTTLGDLRQSVAVYTARAAEKLRSQRSAAQTIEVFVMTNPFKRERQYYNSRTIRLPTPTVSTSELNHYTLKALNELYRPGLNYKKSGVILMDLIPDDSIQGHLLDERGERREHDSRLMRTMDRINRRMGRETLHYAATGIQARWRMQRKHLSPSYTTSWQELPTVRTDMRQVASLAPSVQCSRVHFSQGVNA